jgi:GTPase SAR1 family protein
MGTCSSTPRSKTQSKPVGQRSPPRELGVEILGKATSKNEEIIDQVQSLIKRLNQNDVALQSIDLSGKNIRKEGAKALKIALENKQTLTIDLSSNDIGDEGVKTLSEALENNQTLQTIDLSRNNIGDEGAKALSEALENHQSLQTIYLSGNNIGDEGVKTLSEALVNNQTLQKMYLSGNNIGDEGAKALSVALENNQTLKKIYLYGNHIGDEGAKILSMALQNNQTLQTIYLSYNNIGDEGAFALSVALEKNQTLQFLLLGGNKISAKGLEALNVSYLLNSTLQEAQGFKKEVLGFGDADSIFSALHRAYSKNPEAVTNRLTKIEMVPTAYHTLIRCWEESQSLSVLDVPKSVVDRGSEAVKEYFQAFKQGGDPKPRMVISIVGAPNAGKTSLIQSLLDDQHRGCATNREVEGATVGVINSHLQVGTQENSPIFIFRDFGGQEEYERSHSFFQQNRCIVFFVVDLLNYNAEEFKQHIGYYYEKMSSARISKDNSALHYLVVGTKIDQFAGAEGEQHLDKICKQILTQLDEFESETCSIIRTELEILQEKPQEDGLAQNGISSLNDKKKRQTDEQVSERMRFLTTLLQTRPVPLFNEVFRVSCKPNGSSAAIGVPQLLEFLTDLAPTREHGQTLPKPYVDLLRYFDTEKEIARRNKAAPIVTLSDIIMRWCHNGIEGEFRFSERGLITALQVLGDVGEILWYSFVDTQVFIEPTFLMNAVKQIFRHDMLDNNSHGGLTKVIKIPEELEQAKADYSRRGYLALKYLKKFDDWNEMDVESTVPVVLRLLEKFGLAYAIEEDTLYIPSAVMEDDEEKNPALPALGERNAIRSWKFPTFEPKGLISTFTVLFHGETFIKTKPRYSHSNKTISILVSSLVYPKKHVEITLQQKENAMDCKLELILLVTGPDSRECFDFLKRFEEIVDTYLLDTFAYLFVIKYVGYMSPSQSMQLFRYREVVAARDQGDSLFIPDDDGKPIDLELLLGPVTTTKTLPIVSECKYEYFLSHRVNTEGKLANWFYLYLNNKQKTTFLDVQELPTGQLWQNEFIDALSSSKHFVLFMSWNQDESGSIGQMMKFSHGDYCDNVLLEILFAFCMMKNKCMKSFTPILIGGIEKDQYLEFPFNKVQFLPDIVSYKTLEALEQNMQSIGYSVPPDVKTLTVRAAVFIILSYNGVKLSKFGEVIIAQEAAAKKLLDLKD